MQMLSWFILLTFFATFLAFLATRARRHDLSRASCRVPRALRRPKTKVAPCVHAGPDSSVTTPTAPNLEHDGRVYFFASIAERDTCSAHLRGLALAKSKALMALRVVH